MSDVVHRIHALREIAFAAAGERRLRDAFGAFLVAADLAEEHGMRVGANLLRGQARRVLAYGWALARWSRTFWDDVTPVRQRHDDLRLRPPTRFRIYLSSIDRIGSDGRRIVLEEPVDVLVTVDRRDRVRRIGKRVPR